jgi:hypothetical protein
MASYAVPRHSHHASLGKEESRYQTSLPHGIAHLFAAGVAGNMERLHAAAMVAVCLCMAASQVAGQAQAPLINGQSGGWRQVSLLGGGCLSDCKPF